MKTLRKSNLYFVICIIIVCVNGSSASEQCNRYFSLERGTIIEAKKSEENGAHFIKSTETTSVDECYSLCCKISACNVAIYENKKKHTCYLFDCLTPSVCTYTNHTHYVRIRESSQKVDHPPSKPSSRDSSRKPKVQPKKKLPPALLGESCYENRACHVPNAICSRSTCVCDSGFVEKHGKCVNSVCRKPELEFQCDDVSKSPACIATYDRCNGIAECGDGSDELNCPGHASLVDEDSVAPEKDVVATPHKNEVPTKQSEAAVDTKTEVSNDERSDPGELYAPLPADIEMLEQSNHQAHIALVALGLGLLITVALIALLILRMKRMRKHLRRGGKTLAADEAEHLMNGMYL